MKQVNRVVKKRNKRNKNLTKSVSSKGKYGKAGTRGAVTGISHGVFDKSTTWTQSPININGKKYTVLQANGHPVYAQRSRGSTKRLIRRFR